MGDAAVVIDALGLLTIIWVFRLVRRERLYVGYGVIFVAIIALGSLTLTFAVVLGALHPLSRISQRGGALIGLTVVFVVVMLIYILSQLTLLSNRITRLTQELAIRNASSGAESDDASRPDDR